MNPRSWTLDGFAFRILVERSGRDRLPFPIQYQPSADSAADYHRLRHEAGAVVDTVLDDDLRVAMHALIAPKVRIEVVGYLVAAGSPGASGSVPHKLRGHAAIGHDVAVVLAQAPGVDERSGGPVTITVLEPSQALPLVLSVLPDSVPGSTPRFVADSQQAAHSDTSPLLRMDGRQTDNQRLAHLLSRPRSGVGEILVCAGAAADNRLTHGTTGVNWIDVSGDGRYLLRHGRGVTVLPASHADLNAEIRTLLRDATAQRC